jgi:hypothetical protein
MRMLLCLAILVLIASPVQAQENLPAEVTAAVEANRKECDGTFTTKKGFVSRRDVNGDGELDYILDYEHTQCDGFVTLFCGTGGCVFQVFVSLGDGKFAKVMDRNAFTVKFARRNGLPAMIQDLHGGACGRSGGDGPCRSITYWNGEEFTPAFPLNRGRKR